jgi:hypothetical protein
MVMMMMMMIMTMTTTTTDLICSSERVNEKIHSKFLWTNLDGGPFEERQWDGMQCLSHGLQFSGRGNQDRMFSNGMIFIPSFTE